MQFRRMKKCRFIADADELSLAKNRNVVAFIWAQAAQILELEA